ncbi:MAG: hypothetical protein JO285_04915 [Kutzneria sp.]|nr:hypothetical protein [Kutzneria sp.]
MLADRERNAARHDGTTGNWTLRIGSRSDVRTALFLRDVLALTVPADPYPPTDPWVPVLPAGDVDRAAVAAEWLDWFDSILDGACLDAEDSCDPASDWMARWPAVRGALSVFADPVRRWEEQLRRRDRRQPRVDDLVAAAGSELDRQPRAFELAITELPVRGQFWVRRGHSQVLVSPTLLDNLPAFGWALRPLIRELS